MKRKKINICFALVLSVLAGCSSEECVIDDVIKAEKQKDVEVINGTLHFKDAESFMRISTEMANMDEDKRLEWENKNGFKSLNRSLTELMKTYDYDESVANLYPNYFEYTDSMLSISVPQSYNVVANSNGVFYVQDVIHKVNKDGVAYVINGSEKDVSEIVDGTRTCSAGESNIVRFDGKTEACGLKSLEMNAYRNKFWDSKAYDGHKCKLTVTFFIKSVIDNNVNKYRYAVEVKIENQKRKPHTYRDHHAECWYRHFTLSYMKPVDYYGDLIYYEGHDIGIKDSDSSTHDVVTFSKTGYLGEYNMKQKPQEPIINSLYIEASNEDISGYTSNIIIDYTRY